MEQNTGSGMNSLFVDLFPTVSGLYPGCLVEIEIIALDAPTVVISTAPLVKWNTNLRVSMCAFTVLSVLYVILFWQLT